VKREIINVSLSTSSIQKSLMIRKTKAYNVEQDEEYTTPDASGSHLENYSLTSSDR